MDSVLQQPSSFQQKLKKYWAGAYVNMQNSQALTSNIVSSGLAVLLRIWIFTQLYQATFAETGVTTIGGFTLAMTVWSLMLTQSFESASRPSAAKVINREIQDGTLAYSVSKPYSYILFHFWSTLGRTLPMMVSSILIGSIMSYALVGFFPLNLLGIVFGAINLFLGYLLDFLINLILGISTLWIEEVDAVLSIYHKLRLVFGGLILPIALFPDFIKTISELLPFSQLYYSAARQVVSFDLHTFAMSISIQLFWILFFSIIARYIFAKGMRYLSVNGG